MKKIESLVEIGHLLLPEKCVVLHSALAEPLVLSQQLADHSEQLAGVSVYCLMPMGATQYGRQPAASSLHINTFLPGAGLRRSVNDGTARQHPVRLFDISAFFGAGKQRADVLFLQLSPPDANGDLSLGLSVDYMHTLLVQKPLVVAEINPQMPCTPGDTRIPQSVIDFAIDVDYTPQTMPAGKADAIDEKVAENVVGLLGNGAVLQYGIGTIPELVPVRTGHLKNLSIHTGLLTDVVMPALQTGAFDNSGQADHPGKVVTTMAGGSASLYQWLHNNEEVIFKPTTYTHSREVLQRINKLVAINSVLQVDLCGNANAERTGGRIISGPGGLFDFARGATQASGGMSVLAIRSTTRKGDQSCIVSRLPDDAATSVTVEHLDYVVTEHGVASVRGKTGAALAGELRLIADPLFRAELVNAAP